MGFSNTLRVLITGDTKGLERSFARANQATATFGRNVDGAAKRADKATRSFKGLATGAGAGFAGGLVASELLAQGRAAVDVASNLQEQLSKSNVIFGKSADVISKWSETTAESMGIARDEAVAAAATFGTIFTAAGRSTDDAARLSKSVVQLAADLASFNNTSVEDSLTALRSGLSGEIEPLRRFQVFLTEASVAQEAMAQSGKRSARELTQGEKILARYALITQQTAKQSGDFERTQDSLANKQRKLAAQTRDLQGKIGNGLVPVMEAYVGFASQAVDTTVALGDAMKALGEVEIPVIEIPLKIVFDKGSSTFGANLLKNLLPPQLGSALPFIEAIRDLMEPKKQSEEISKALGDTYNEILEDAIAGIPPFGLTTLPTTGENFALDFSKGINAAIDSAQALAKTTIAEGKERIAADKAKIAAEKAAEALKRRNEALRKLEEARRAAVQRSQFRALGLSGEGTELVPGVENLRKQLDTLTKRLAGSDVKTKLADRLEGVQKLLTGKFGKVTEATRAAIRDLFDSIRQEFKQGNDQTERSLTRTSALNGQKILEGLGLDRATEKELRARLSSFNSAGQQLSGSRRPTGNFSTGNVVVENHNTINLDGETVGRKVTRSQQKQRRRNSVQKRGPRSGV